MDALDLVGLGHAIADVDPPVGDGRAAVAAGDRDAPLPLDLGRIELVDDARLGPDAVAVRTPPLGPLVGL